MWGVLIKLIAILLMMAGLPAFFFVLKASGDPTISVILLIIYEVVVFVGGFLTKVWEKLESRWTERLANQIDQVAQNSLSNYRDKYLEYIIYQHRFFDVKGLRTQGPYSLELERVFIQLCVDPTPVLDTTSNPIQQIPEGLRSGSHIIWEYITAKGMRNQNLAVLGPPGCGKTTLFKHMAMALAGPDHSKETGGLDLLPILLFLRDNAADIQSDPSIHLAKLIRKQFEHRQAPIPPDGWLEEQLEQGRCLVMLDGLDEVADIETRKCVVTWVERCMCGVHGGNRFIISSRPHGYKANPLANVTVLQVKPFTNKQVKQFVHNWYLANEIMSSQRDDPGVRADARLGAEDLLKRLFNTPTLSDLAVNPLLLTMIATVHRYRSSLPGRRVELYAEICEVFLGKRQEARGLVSDLTPMQKQLVLQPLAFYMMFKELREIKQADIEPVIKKQLSSVSPGANVQDFIKYIENTSGLIVERESGEYSFSHLTFQEFLAAVFILENRMETGLAKMVGKSWWHETIRLYCAQTDASNIIQACLDAATIPALGLAIDCMEEAREVNLKVRENYNHLIQKGLESPDPQLRNLIAEARLSTRLRNR